MAVFAGFAIIVLAVPLNAVAAGISRRYQLEQMTNKDHRVKLMNEILGGIKVGSTILLFRRDFWLFRTRTVLRGQVKFKLCSTRQEHLLSTELF